MSGTRASNDRSSHLGGGLKRARSEPGGNKVTVVLGAQWGDEGKGKVVDLLATESDIVCRCQVGAKPAAPAAPPWRFPALRFVLSSGRSSPPAPLSPAPSFPCGSPGCSPLLMPPALFLPPPARLYLLPLLAPVGFLPPLPASSSSPSALPQRAAGRECALVGSHVFPTPPQPSPAAPRNATRKEKALNYKYK